MPRDWLTRAVEAQGYRLDDVKGLSTLFLRPFLNSKSMAGKFAVGEFFDGNPSLVDGWVNNPRGMQGRASAFDFPLKFMLNAMCNRPGNFDMSTLDHTGLTGLSPEKAVTFVENHDTDLKPKQNIFQNKMMGYAYILTSEGYPAVFYKDYSTDPGCYGLQAKIDNLVWIHEVLASGTTVQRWKDFDVFAYERQGGSKLLVALNNDPHASHAIQVQTGFGANVHLKDYTGHGADVVTGGDGAVKLVVPANIDGLGYACYSPIGQDRALATGGRATTQDFEGAADLDLLPVINGETVTAGRIWCEAGTPVNLALSIDRTGWSASTSVEISLASSQSVLQVVPVTSTSTMPASLEQTTRGRGFYTIQLTASDLPAATPTLAYKLSAMYTAPRTFSAGDAAENAAVAADAFQKALDPAKAGRWSDIIKLPNVPIHAHLLPNGKVLFWGRRTPPGTLDYDSLNQHSTQAFVWDPTKPKAAPIVTANEPEDEHGNTINLFCSSHTFLEDGTLMVTGGHLFDSQGLDTSTIYDWRTNSWTAKAGMHHGRWYPTAITLADGTVFVCEGTYATGTAAKPPNNFSQHNTVPEIFANDGWNEVMGNTGISLFPRLHLAPDGSVFVAGTNAQGLTLEGFDTHGRAGTWVEGESREVGNADYAPSVMYEAGKVVYIGGGGGDDNNTPPTDRVETIDLNAVAPMWAPATSMHFCRRQHNGTILADGTVLVTGGCQVPGFDSLGDGETIRIPELWDPVTDTWTQMAPEAEDRCYHSTAVLLPDGTVFSGGGGEYDPDNTGLQPNPPFNTHADCQVFTPPYLSRGPRPTVSNAPAAVVYGQSFDIDTPEAAEIEKVTWIRLSSVTHSFNTNQRLNFLPFTAGLGKLTITAPANGKISPPGHYMLFVLNGKGVPSEAAIVQITAGVVAKTTREVAQFAARVLASPFAVLKQQTPVELDADLRAREGEPKVTVGVSAGCPYGIAACWGGAYESLKHLDGVRLVLPMPDERDSTAFLYLDHDGLPNLDRWPSDFAKIANGTHTLLGVEITRTAPVSVTRGGGVSMQGDERYPTLVLSPMQAADKVQWDAARRAPQALGPLEVTAYQRLLTAIQAADGSVEATVTGPLKKDGAGAYLGVRTAMIHGAAV